MFTFHLEVDPNLVFHQVLFSTTTSFFTNFSLYFESFLSMNVYFFRKNVTFYTQFGQNENFSK